MANAGLSVALCLGISLIQSVVSKYDEYNCISNIMELVEEYEELRLNEVSIEESMWTGGALVLNDTTNEVKANKIFVKYKRDELRKYRNITSENPAAMHFYDAKDEIENSKVYQIIRKMPKGANLNMHAWGSVSSDWLTTTLSYINGLSMCQFQGRFAFTFRDNSNYDNCQKLWDIRKNDSKGGFDEVFNTYFNLYKSKPKDKILLFREVVNALFDMFVAINDALNYKPAYEKFYYQMLQEMYDDNIMYAEVRIHFQEIYGKNNKNYTREDAVQTLINVVKKFKRTHKDFLGIKFIYALIRHNLPEMVQAEIEIFKKLQKKFPNYIIGLDFVGWEDYGSTLKRHLKDFIQLKKEGYNFYFRAGETNRNGHTSDFNLYDAILLKSKRIGHGYALWKHPILMEKVMSESIAIEICPVTNQISGLVADLRNHPGGIYLSEDAPLIVGNDAPGFLGTAGLSTDFYYTIMSLASNKADLRTLKQLALNSISYSVLSEKMAINAIKLFTEKWNKFLDDIVREYSVQKIMY